MLDLPSLYFRRKDKGAAVFRTAQDTGARLNMQRIAVLKPNGDVKPFGKQTLTAAALTKIAAWHTDQSSIQTARDTARIDNLITEMNAAAQWLQSSASNKQVADNAPTILMAMHDLRTTLVRKMSEK